MSALSDLAWPQSGWPEHFKAEDDFSSDQFLAKISDAATKPGDDDATVPPWLEMQSWTHPGPKGEAFFYSDDDLIALRGPVGSGKTTANLRSRIRRASRMPRSVIDGVRRYKVVIARATYRQLWQTTIPSWWQIFPKNIGKWAGGRGDPVTHTIEWEDDYGKIEFIAEFLAFGESPGEIEANMRGVETTDLLLEEADTCHVAVMTTGSTRINRFPGKKHFKGYDEETANFGQISMTYNATDVENWVVKAVETEDSKDPEIIAMRKAFDEEGIKISFWRQPGYGEPGRENSDFVKDSYYQRQIVLMKAAGETDKIERLVRNHNSYIVEGDPVFKSSFNRSIHVASEPLKPWPGVPIMLGLDQGLFGAAVVGQWVSPYRWQILDEFWRPHRMLAQEFGEELAQFLSEKYPNQTIDIAYGDMAGENDSGAAGENAVWNRVVGNAIGVYIHPQTNGSNHIQPRLSAIRAGLANTSSTRDGLQPDLLISPNCALLIRGFMAQYVWTTKLNPKGEKTKTPDKSKRAADVMDALAYMMLSQSPIAGMPPNSTRVSNPNARHNGGPALNDGGDNYSYNPINDWNAA